MRSGDWSQNPHMGQRLWLIIAGLNKVLDSTPDNTALINLLTRVCMKHSLDQLGYQSCSFSFDGWPPVPCRFLRESTRWKNAVCVATRAFRQRPAVEPACPLH